MPYLRYVLEVLNSVLFGPLQSVYDQKKKKKKKKKKKM